MKLKGIWASHMSALLRKQSSKYTDEEIRMQNKWRTKLTNQRINKEVTLNDFRPKYSPHKRRASDNPGSKSRPIRNIARLLSQSKPEAFSKLDIQTGSHRGDNQSVL